MTLKSLFPWVGGKKKEIDKYIQYFPKDIDTYFEPFVGGGATFFHLNHNKNVISDVHTELTDFYKCIKNDEMEDIHNFMTENNNDKETYYKIRDMEINSPLDNAKRFYYLRKTCFGGMLQYNKNGDFNVGYGYRKNCNFTDLKNENYVDLLKNTTVLNTSFEYVFSNYDDPKNFMFLDPPYYDCKITNYGYGEFGKEEHKKLAEYFKATNIQCLMIISKNDFIESLYDGYIVEQYYKTYDLNSINKNVEEAIHLIIKNY